MANTYWQGQMVRVQATFYDQISNTPVAPTQVWIAYQAPGGTVQRKQFGVDTGFTNPSAGVYTYDINATTPGTWMYRWYSTGSGQAASDSGFNVTASPLF